VQVGWDPDRALLVRPPIPGATAALAALLRAVDGLRSLDELQPLATAAGLGSRGLDQLLAELVDAGLVDWAPPSGTAVRPVAALHGQGPLTEALADGLRAAGVDIRRSDGREPVRRGAGADVVVLTDCLVVDPCVVSELVGAGSPHLPVLLRDGVGMVGPLVLPGRSSCLRCADLHRSDRDPEWPALAAQLFGRIGYGSAAAVRATAGLALGEVEHLLRGGAGGEPAPGSLGATLELDLRHGTLRRRPWPPHPRCGCGTHR